MSRLVCELLNLKECRQDAMPYICVLYRVRRKDFYDNEVTIFYDVCFMAYVVFSLKLGCFPWNMLFLYARRIINF